MRGVIGRRDFLRRLGVAAGGTLIATRRQTRAEARSHDTAGELRAPEPNARRGGTLRYGVPSSPAHFSTHIPLSQTKPGWQRSPSSTRPLQSSSMPLQVSALLMIEPVHTRAPPVQVKLPTAQRMPPPLLEQSAMLPVEQAGCVSTA